MSCAGSVLLLVSVQQTERPSRHPSPGAQHDKNTVILHILRAEMHSAEDGDDEDADDDGCDGHIERHLP